MCFEVISIKYFLKIIKPVIIFTLFVLVFFISCEQYDYYNKQRKIKKLDTLLQNNFSNEKNQNNKSKNKIFGYTINNCNIYKSTVLDKIVAKLSKSEHFEIIEDTLDLYRIKSIYNKIGYLKKKMYHKNGLKFGKKEHKLFLMEGKDKLTEYPVSFGFNPVDDEIQQGDGCTPEGRFYICEMLENPQPEESYGARSMRISYPNLEDARRGLRDRTYK